MANASLGTLAISLSLWAADLGASHLRPAVTPIELGTTHVAVASAVDKTCTAGAATPSDSDSDLEVVVCAKPLTP